MSPVLASEFVTRAPTRSDVQAIADLIAAYDLAVMGEVVFGLSNILQDWDAPRFDLTQDARVVVAPDGSIIAYETLYHVDPSGLISTDGYVHPKYTGRGIASHLLEWAEARARERLSEFSHDLGVTLKAGFSSDDKLAYPLFESLGYSAIRHYWNMQIDMLEKPPAPSWAEGITARPFDPDRDHHAVWQAINDSFGLHWGMAPISFEDWMVNESGDFVPDLSFLAMAGEEVAAVVLCKYHMDNGKVLWLGVRPPWRRLGLGMALLHQAFGEFYRRSTTRVELRVDAENVTGATRVYERAGMRVTHRFDIYGKELRMTR